MQDSKHSSKQSSHNNQKEETAGLPSLRRRGFRGGFPLKGRTYAIIFVILSLIGFTDATYLTLKHYSGTAITCSLTHGCDEVTSSAYSEIFGIPVALFGALFYLTIILLSVYFFDKKKEATLTLISKLTWLGLGAAVYFTAIQAFVLHAWCQYCIASAITSTMLFITGMTYLYNTSIFATR